MRPAAKPGSVWIEMRQGAAQQLLIDLEMVRDHLSRRGIGGLMYQQVCEVIGCVQLALRRPLPQIMEKGQIKEEGT